ncbi:DUF4102 domain-containing protein [Paraburkholderia sp. Ac-20342]|uniref:Arm DNA-binding domain-containing protein n=1 Tax=Paraburkholderia sp. Ac-20342 TaxID=2703889 RepID=UPI00197CDF82|nr:Arm DNA-binding domain-containing protein [Paraburkholderia sp. Ac-20342]MBN3847918.1 DUF4102 domain-containing protein [Paraburkholderia sp. Ac-20342]
MPKQIAPLTELQIRKAKPAEQPYRLADGKGLYLQVMPNGSRYWRMKYRFDDKEKLASFGVYPEVSLADARKACLVARQLLTAGTDPSEQKKEVKRARALESETTATYEEASHCKKPIVIARIAIRRSSIIVFSRRFPPSTGVAGRTTRKQP